MTKESERKKRSFRRKLLRVALVLFLLFLLFPLLLVLLFQFSSFRSSFLRLVEKQLHQHVFTETTRIYIGDVRGTLWNSLEFRNVLITVDGDTLFWCPSLSLRYNVEKLLQRRIDITTASLDSPLIRLKRRNGDSLWNYQKAIRPSSRTEASPVQWSLSIGNFRITDGRFEHYTEERLHQQRKGFDAEKIFVSGLDLSSAFFVNLGEGTGSAFIRKMQLFEKNTEMAVQQLRGTIRKTRTEFEVFRTSFQTEQSGIRIDLLVEQLEKHRSNLPLVENIVAQASIAVDSLSLSEVKKVIPSLAIGDGVIQADILGTVSNGEVKIRNLKLSSGRSTVRLFGTMALQEALDRSSMNLQCSGRIDGADVVRLFSPLIPAEVHSIEQLTVNIQQLTFQGIVQKGTVFADLRTSLGKIDGTIDYDVRMEQPSYRAHLTFAHFSPDLFFPAFQQTELTGKLQLSGEGIDAESLDAVASLQLQKSKFASFPIGAMQFHGKIKQKVVWIDSLVYTPSAGTPPQLSFTGHIAPFTDIPHYSLHFRSEQLDVKKILPEHQFLLSSDLRIEGSGFSPDDFTGMINGSISQLDFPEKSLYPFDFSLSIAGTAEKKISFESDFGSAQISGKFRWGALIPQIVEHARTIGEYFVNIVQLRSAVPVLSSNLSSSDTLRCSFTIELWNPVFLQVFLPQPMELWLQAFLQGSLESHPHQNSRVSLDSVHLRNFELRLPETEVKIYELFGALSHVLDYSDMQEGTIAAQFRVPYGLMVQSLDWKTAFVELQQRGQLLHLTTTGAMFQDSLRYRLAASFTTDSNRVAAQIDTLSVQYGDLPLRNIQPILLTLYRESLVIQDLQLVGPHHERFHALGVWNFDRYADMSLQLTDFGIDPYLRLLMNGDTTKTLSQIKGQLKFFQWYLRGELTDPEIAVLFRTDTIWIGETVVGKMEGSIQHSHQSMQGNVVIQSLRQGIEQLTVEVFQLPIGIDLRSFSVLVDSLRPVYIAVKSNAMDLAVLQPILPFVSNLQGVFTAQLTISGYLPADVSYDGGLTIQAGRFFVPATNIQYTTHGALQFRKDTIIVDTLIVENDPNDLRGGYGILTGQISLRGFEVSGLNLRFATPKFLVLSRASQMVSPWVYGTVILRTRSDLRLSGSLNAPVLSGEIDVIKAELIFPQEQQTPDLQKPFCFEKIIYQDGKKIRIDRNCPDAFYEQDGEETQQKENAEHIPVLQQSFVQRIQYSLVLRLDRPVIVTMEFSPFEQLVAELSANEPLYYITDPITGETQMYGELYVLKGSTYKFYRIFSAEGKISFRTGLSNPELDLIAELQGQRYTSSGLETYRVVIYITGTKQAPKLRFVYYLNGEEQAGDPQELQTNSIFLVLFGRTREEFQQQGGNPQFASIVTASISSGLSKFITEVLQGTGIVQSADIIFQQIEDFGQLDLSQAQIRLRGEFVPLGVLWQYGGEFGNITRSVFEIDFPLRNFTNVEALRNLVLQIRRQLVESSSFVTQEKEYEVKLTYRYSW